MRKISFTYLLCIVLGIEGYVPYKQVEMTVGMKVNTYLSTIKDKIVTLQEGPRLISALNRYAIVSLRKVPKLANELVCLSIPENIATDQIYAAALMQMAIPLIDTFKRDVMNLITSLENSKKYWELKRENQSSLTMQVQQWMGRTNKKLNDKIKILDAYLDQQFTNLGALTLHLDTFNETKSPDEQFAWIQQLCTIIITAYPQSKLQPREVSFEQVVTMLVLASKCALHYPVAMHQHIKPYRMPTNFNRYLATGSLTVGITSALALTMHENKKVIKEGMQQASESIKTFAVEQQDRIKEAFFGNAQEEKDLQDQYKKILDDLYDALVPPATPATNALIVSSGKQEEDNSSTVKKVDKITHTAIGPILQGQRNKFDQANINIKAKEINVVYFENTIMPMLFNLLNIESQMASASTKKFAAAKVSELDLSLGENFGISIEKMRKEVYKIWQGKDLESEEVPTQEKQSLQKVMRAAGDPIQKISTVIDTMSKIPSTGWLYGQVARWNFNKQTRIFKAILTSIPIYLVISESAKGLYALYKKLHGSSNYDAIREALVDTALLLNIYKRALPSEMAVDDYGRLIYLIGRLKDPQIMQLIPHEYRSSFASNVQFLESSTLSAAEKLNIIDLMYKRYPFLAHDMRALSAKAA